MDREEAVPFRVLRIVSQLLSFRAIVPPQRGYFVAMAREALPADDPPTMMRTFGVTPPASGTSPAVMFVVAVSFSR